MVYSFFFWKITSEIVTNRTFFNVILFKIRGRNGVTVKRKIRRPYKLKNVAEKYTCWIKDIRDLIKALESCFCKANQAGKLLEPI